MLGYMHGCRVELGFDRGEEEVWMIIFYTVMCIKRRTTLGMGLRFVIRSGAGKARESSSYTSSIVQASSEHG